MPGGEIMRQGSQTSRLSGGCSGNKKGVLVELKASLQTDRKKNQAYRPAKNRKKERKRVYDRWSARTYIPLAKALSKKQETL